MKLHRISPHFRTIERGRLISRLEAGGVLSQVGEWATSTQRACYVGEGSQTGTGSAGAFLDSKDLSCWFLGGTERNIQTDGE